MVGDVLLSDLADSDVPVPIARSPIEPGPKGDQNSEAALVCQSSGIPVMFAVVGDVGSIV